MKTNPKFHNVAFQKRARTAAYIVAKSGGETLVLSMPNYLLIALMLLLESWRKFFQEHDDLLVISARKVQLIQSQLDSMIQSEAFQERNVKDVSQINRFFQPVSELQQSDPKALCVPVESCPQLIELIEAHSDYNVLMEYEAELPNGEVLWKEACDRLETLRSALKLPARFRYNKFKRRDSI